MAQVTRVAIVGTAESWKQAPWHDPSVAIWGLNDAYTLRFPRVDAWFDLHPTDHFYYRPIAQRVVYAEDVPTGYYVRPEGHLEQLKAMAASIPVFLQGDPPAGWPANARRFPREATEAFIGSGYWASGPAFMVAYAIMLGVEEIQVWGIHLATEQEYRDQRPNFEHLLGIARGKGIQVVMAPQSPVLKHPWVYGYEPKPAPSALRVALKKASFLEGQLTQRLAGRRRWASAEADHDRLRRTQALALDCQRGLSLEGLAPIVAPIYAEVRP